MADVPVGAGPVVHATQPELVDPRPVADPAAQLAGLEPERTPSTTRTRWILQGRSGMSAPSSVIRQTPGITSPSRSSAYSASRTLSSVSPVARELIGSGDAQLGAQQREGPLAVLAAGLVVDRVCVVMSVLVGLTAVGVELGQGALARAAGTHTHTYRGCPVFEVVAGERLAARPVPEGARVVIPLHFESWAHFTQGADELKARSRATGSATVC